jgi:hypothetical protein
MLPLTILLALAPALVAGQIVDHAPTLDLTRIKKFAVTDNAPPTQYIQIPIDHFGGKTKDTFKNRYWYNDTFYEPNGPVVVMDVGESNAAPFVTFLEEARLQSAVMQVARKYKGIGVVWEHRFYGESVPFINGNLTGKSLTADQWKYHTVQQALEDVVYFSSRFNTSKASAATLSPSKTPWIFMGGSYPGVRAALLRVRNPDVIYASWASSAPVQAQVNMSSYWDTIQRALPRNCSNDFVAMASYANEAFAKNDTAEAQLKQLLVLADSAGQQNLSLADAAKIPDSYAGSILQDPLNNWQDSGLAFAQTVCDFLETANYTQKASDSGLFASVPTTDAVDAFATTIYAVAVTNAQSASPSHQKRNHLRLRADDVDQQNNNVDGDTLAWQYQYCSQLGFFQAADPNNKRSIQAQAVSYQYFQDQCTSSFPKGALPSSPDVNGILQFGGWVMNPSRTMFTNGAIDPWRSLGVASTEYNAPQRTANKTIPSATGHFDNSSYFGAIYDNTVHAKDLANFEGYTSEEALPFKTGLALFTAALDEWLPAFNSSRDTQSNSSSSSNSTSTSSNGTSSSNGNGHGSNAGLTFSVPMSAIFTVAVLVIAACAA